MRRSLLERILRTDLKQRLIDRGIPGYVATAIAEKQTANRADMLETMLQWVYLEQHGWRRLAGRWYEPGAPTDPSRHAGWLLAEAVAMQQRMDAQEEERTHAAVAC